MKFIRKNWYGFDHAEVNKKFSGDLTFLNSFSVYNEYNPVAVYKAKTPDVAKGHKKYLLLQVTWDGKLLVRGMTTQEMKPERQRAAIHCLTCDEVIFSANRHDYTICTCKKSSIDGGKGYTIYQSDGPTDTFNVDLLTGKKILSKVDKYNKKFKKLVNV